MQNLVNSSGWKTLKEDINEKINEIEKEILENVSPEDNKPEYSKHDILRCKRQAYKYLLDLPSAYLDEPIEMEDL